MTQASLFDISPGEPPTEVSTTGVPPDDTARCPNP